MKTKMVIGSLLASFVLASSANASERPLEGSFANDADATVSMTVVVRHGEPRKAKDITVTGLDYACPSTGESGERDASFRDAAVFPSDRERRYEFETEVTEDGATFLIGGLMRRSAATVRGGAAFFFETPGGFCESGAAGVGLFAAR